MQMSYPRLSIQFLSTPSARRATCHTSCHVSSSHISIHALREEGDFCATAAGIRTVAYFYPRPPRGGRHLHRVARFQAHEISIHALREEGDGCSADLFPAGRFLSTPSARRATKDREPERDRLEISIHALREEGDSGDR